MLRRTAAGVVARRGEGRRGCRESGCLMLLFGNFGSACDIRSAQTDRSTVPFLSFTLFFLSNRLLSRRHRRTWVDGTHEIGIKSKYLAPDVHELLDVVCDCEMSLLMHWSACVDGVRWARASH